MSYYNVKKSKIYSYAFTSIFLASFSLIYPVIEKGEDLSLKRKGLEIGSSQQKRKKTNHWGLKVTFDKDNNRLVSITVPEKQNIEFLYNDSDTEKIVQESISFYAWDVYHELEDSSKIQSVPYTDWSKNWICLRVLMNIPIDRFDKSNTEQQTRFLFIHTKSKKMITLAHPPYCECGKLIIAGKGDIVTYHGSKDGGCPNFNLWLNLVGKNQKFYLESSFAFDLNSTTKWSKNGRIKVCNQDSIIQIYDFAKPLTLTDQDIEYQSLPEVSPIYDTEEKPIEDLNECIYGRLSANVVKYDIQKEVFFFLSPKPFLKMSQIGELSVSTENSGGYQEMQLSEDKKHLLFFVRTAEKPKLLLVCTRTEDVQYAYNDFFSDTDSNSDIDSNIDSRILELNRVTIIATKEDDRSNKKCVTFEDQKADKNDVVFDKVFSFEENMEYICNKQKVSFHMVDTDSEFPLLDRYPVFITLTKNKEGRQHKITLTICDRDPKQCNKIITFDSQEVELSDNKTSVDFQLNQKPREVDYDTTQLIEKLTNNWLRYSFVDGKLQLACQDDEDQ